MCISDQDKKKGTEHAASQQQHWSSRSHLHNLNGALTVSRQEDLRVRLPTDCTDELRSILVVCMLCNLGWNREQAAADGLGHGFVVHKDLHSSPNQVSAICTLLHNPSVHFHLDAALDLCLLHFTGATYQQA